MSVSAPFIRRPIATTLLAFAALLAGALGYSGLPISALPQVDFPTILVTTQLPGASADTTESLITAPLERQLGQIAALETMTSASSFGISQITLQFDLDRNIDAAAQDVQAAINSAAAALPKGLPYPPTYAKVNPADAPILTLALISETVPLARVSDLADTLLAQRLSEVSGVGHVAVEGGIRPAVRIQADVTRLAGYGLGLEDLRNAILGANVAGPKGSLNGAQQSFTIAADDQLASADAYRSIIVAYRNNAPVRLSDVARLLDGIENAKVASFWRGKPAILIDVQRQPGANVVQTVERVRHELPRLQRAIPADVKLLVVNDRTGTIRASVRDVQFTLVLSVALVVAVVLVFLRTFRATIIAGVALPLSLIATFGAMRLCGYSLDNLSLMALTIGTGFVVDDAIVMIENIVRHVEGGASALDAAFAGAKEIGFTVISLTLSLVAVFIPLLFMGGLVGRLFREFALTLTIAVLVSAAVSLTLTPMMCGRLLRPAHTVTPGGLRRLVERALDGMLRGYRDSLDWVLRRQGLTLLVFAVTLLLTIGLYVAVPKGFLPLQDTALVIAVTEAGQDVSFEQLQRLQAEVADAVRRDPDVTGVASLVGAGTVNATPNTGHLTITLRSRDGRTSSASQIVARLRQRVDGVAGMSVYFQPVQDIQISTRPSRTQYQYTLVDTDAREVAQWAERLVQALRSAPALRDVASDLQQGGLRALVQVDRLTAGRFGVSVQSIDDTLNDLFGQRQVSTIYAQANQYRVVLEAQPQLQRDLSVLAKLYVPSQTDVQVPLASLTRLVHTTAPLAINHQEQFPAVTVSFDLAAGAALGDAVRSISEAERSIGLPPTVTGSYSGDAAEFARSLAGEPWLILAAAVTIYIVLGVLYESFVHPLTILSTLPSAGVGALLALMLCGLDFSVVALIGVILLMGIVKKNAIMMIDFALEAERAQQLSPRESIVQACLLRFRPIMMTTAAALLGAVPLALGHGTGSELRVPLGITIIGGLLLSQLLTLYTTPVVYLWMERLRARLGPSGAGRSERGSLKIGA